MDLSGILYALNVPTFGEWGVITLIGATVLWTSIRMVLSQLRKRRKRQAEVRESQERTRLEEQRSAVRDARKAELTARHGDPEIAERILGRDVWKGQTRLALEDSRGNPYHREKMAAGDKLIDVWKYDKDLMGNAELTVYLLNDEVFDIVVRQYNNDDFIKMMEISDRLAKSDWNLWN